MTLAQQTDILLLDEPTTFLDVSHQVEVLDLLTDLNRARGTTIVIVLHDLNLAARYAEHLRPQAEEATVRDTQIQPDAMEPTARSNGAGLSTPSPAANPGRQRHRSADAEESTPRMLLTVSEASSRLGIGRSLLL